MLTIECSYPCAKNVAIGSHIAATFPIVERDTSARTAPSVTIQLQRTAFTTTAAHPRAPSAAYAIVLAWATRLTWSAMGLPDEAPAFVMASQNNTAYAMLPR